MRALQDGRNRAAAARHAAEALAWVRVQRKQERLRTEALSLKVAWAVVPVTLLVSFLPVWIW